MAVTRIKNNQVTDASGANTQLGINANTKIQNFSITSGKLANNLTYGSDLTITGNLTVQGNSTAIDTTITTIEDPVIVLASTQTSGAPAVDIGFLGFRGNESNIAFVWDESASEFVTAFTSTGETNSTITITSFADFHTQNANIGGNLAIGGNITGAVSFTGNITAGNLLTTGQVSATGNITGGNVATAGAVTATGNVTGGNLLTGGLISATSTITSADTITGGNLATGGTVTATGNVTGGNVLTGGLISATSTITSAANITGGNLLTGGLISATSTITSEANITGGNILTGGLISATGNATAGNVTTAGQITATGNVTGGNVATAGLITATGNVTGGNLLTGGAVSAAGNITANPSSFFIGNGSQLTGVAASSANFPISNGTSNINGALDANITVGVSGTSNVAVFASTGVFVTGVSSTTGNVTGGNVATAGLITATGNITGGNILTPGLISAAGLATSGNVETAGYVSAAGNVYGDNVVTDNVISIGALAITSGANADISIQPNGTGNIVLANTYVNSVRYPVQDQDAASKIYVDNLVSTAISYHEAVVVATTTTLAATTGGTITYAQPNGAANGIGATLTTTGSFNLIDTANVQSANTRILVKNEANAAHNGVYVWSNATVITRSLDTDTYGAGNIDALGINDYFFTTSGNVNKGTAFVVDEPTGTITFGTSNIGFAIFSQTQVYTANTSAGLVLNGTEFSAKVDNDTTAFDGGGNIIVKAGANLTTPNIGAATGTSLSTTGNVQGGNLLTGGFVTATGNLAGGNVTTAGVVTATGNITGGNVDTAGVVTATGNITGGNILTAGVVSATANVTGGNLLTAGLISATSTITSASNITGANITTAGLITATGNITGGNILTGGLISATSTITSDANITGGNLLTGGLISATGNITGGNILFGSGYVSGTGNVYASNFIGNISGNIDAGGANTEIQFNDSDTLAGAPGFTFNKVGNIVTANGNITGANLFTGGTVSATGNATAGNVTTAGLVTATGNITGGNVTTAGVVTATGNITGGNIMTAGLITATGNITGGNLILTGAALDTTAGRLTVNSTSSDADFAVNGNTTANVFYVDAGTGTASFGTSTQTTNAIVAFNATTSILTPVGNTTQRPATGVTGMLRFNTTSNALEIYNNTEWESVGVPVFTVIADQQFNGDGSTLAFTLGSTQTTNSCIVSINGVVQIPTLAYAVAGTDPTCVLTFTEAPAAGDVIDVRQITTTTTVTSIANQSGNASVSTSATAALVTVTGDLSVTGSIIGGNINSTAITNGTSNVTVVSSGGNVTTSVGGTSNVMVVSSTDVTITGNLTVTGNATLSGNILGDRIQNGTTTIDIQSAGGNANITVGGVANIAQFTSTSVVVGANILPTANITYDIGSTSQRFKDLYLSNSTIYLGNSQISANATSLILTNPEGGQTVLAGVTAGITGATVSASGNITGGNILTAGLISATGAITGASVVGGIMTGSSLSVTGTINGTTLTGTSLTVSTGNVSCGNIVNTNANGVGNIGSTGTRFNQVFALASSAQYADLAEKYTADATYATGTVVAFGGAEEVTVSAVDSDRRVAGVISALPSFRMNDGLESEHTAMVALTGRVPTLVTGPVRKGDMMVSAGAGRARAEANPAIGTVIGKALEDHDGADGVIEVVVGRV